MTAPQTHQDRTRHRISVLGIGTELTSGQILNRNASWISKQLSDLGVPTAAHWVVPDDRPLIRRALDLAAEVSDLIFVTGGLGPTTDDFTRDMIAEWTGTALLWDEASWQHIQDRLRPRGITPKESQKQQCYFPQGSTILINRQGTAHGFRLEARDKTLVILPGPPSEIAAIWSDHLALWIPSRFPGLDPWITRSWDTLGQPESTIADLTEEALEGQAWERGYRVHLPYVEVKLSYLKSQESQVQESLQRVEAALAPYTVLRDGEQSWSQLAELLRPYLSVQVLDDVSSGYLMSKLLASAPQLMQDRAFSFQTTHEVSSEVNPAFVQLALKATGPRQAEALLSFKGARRRWPLASPYSSPLLVERERHYFAECAALLWAQELKEL